MSLTFQSDQSTLRKATYTKAELLHILEVLSLQRDQKDTFGNRIREFGFSFLRLFSKNLSSQKFQISPPPVRWLAEMTELLDAEPEGEMSTKRLGSDAYRRIWREASSRSLSEPYWGREFCVWDVLSFLSNVNVDSGLKALDVPRLDRATEVPPQAVGGDSIGLGGAVDPVELSKVLVSEVDMEGVIPRS